MPGNGPRRRLSMPGLLSAARRVFEGIPDEVKARRFPLSDALLCGLAVFVFKSPPLPDFEKRARGRDSAEARNMRTLFGVREIPSDSCMRKRLDAAGPARLRPVFTEIFAALQRGKALEHFTALGGRHLLPIDGTERCKPNRIRCGACRARGHRDGSTGYCRQMLGAALVHPDENTVIPLCPELIHRRDGESKNDSERSAAARFIEKFREDHPKLDAVVLQDGLASNGPHIKLLRSKNLGFILGARPGDHKFLFSWVKNNPGVRTPGRTQRTGIKKIPVIRHSFRWVNNAPLNGTHYGEAVNFLEYGETRQGGKRARWSRVTDIDLNGRNVMAVMRAARTGRRIENEVFQTLKGGTGHSPGHTHGHGRKHPAGVSAFPAPAAMLIDQAQEMCCALFSAALKFRERRKCLWEAMRSSFEYFRFDSLEPPSGRRWRARRRGPAPRPRCLTVTEPRP